MSTAARIGRARTAVERVSRTAGSADEFLGALSGEFHRIVPHDGRTWFGVDPVTLLATAPSRVENLTPICATPSGTSSSTSRTSGCSPTSPGATAPSPCS